jgi:hypothetical protein
MGVYRFTVEPLFRGCRCELIHSLAMFAIYATHFGLQSCGAGKPYGGTNFGR